METATLESTKTYPVEEMAGPRRGKPTISDRLGARGLRWAEEGRLPDFLLRMGIRSLLRKRLSQDVPAGGEHRARLFKERIGALKSGPIALCTDDANSQHYEVPAALFEVMLGPRLKYSSCYWEEACNELAQAEERMLALTCERAKLEDGQRILELGCGWGSLSLWMAERFPASRIVAVSNSHSQADHIRNRCYQRNLTNLEVVTANVAEFSPQGRFDRVVSVEMFEHLRNYQEMLTRIAGWLTPGGYFFAHVFCHRDMVYFFEDESQQDWMTRYFFSGGIMPSDRVFFEFETLLRVADHWSVSGLHYSKTLEAWLANLDRNRLSALQILSDHYGPENARVWLGRWRLFLLACSELFRYHQGHEWKVSHTLLRKPALGS